MLQIADSSSRINFAPLFLHFMLHLVVRIPVIKVARECGYSEGEDVNDNDEL